MPVTIALHFWRLTDAETADTLARHLSKDEAARAARFVFEKDRIAYRIGRGRLREILGAATGQAPGALGFSYGSHGKPFLPGGPAFNLSHSDGLACLAIAARVLGADIEAHREIEEGVAERFFSPQEFATLSALPPEEWTPGFFRCWTRKEAVVKAMGDGLSIPLDRFDVTLRPGEPARMTRLDPAHGALAGWRLAHLDLGPGMAGALAMETGGDTLAPEIREVPEGLAVHASA